MTYANVHHIRQGEGIVEFADRKGLDYVLDRKRDMEFHGRKLKYERANPRGFKREFSCHVARLKCQLPICDSGPT